MDDTPLKAWLCKHCSERVDPTMEVCWNCGHDREGIAHPTVFVDPVEVDLTHCGACGYSLKGIPDAIECPECGEPVPWQDCSDCGVRANRIEMRQGCPACKAMEVGEPYKTALDEPGEPVLTEEQLYERSASRSGITSMVIATFLLLIGMVLMPAFGPSFICMVAVICLGLYTHGLAIMLEQRRVRTYEDGDDLI